MSLQPPSVRESSERGVVLERATPAAVYHLVYLIRDGFSQPCPEPRLVVPGLSCLSTYVLTTGVGETLLRVLQIAGATCAFR